MFSRFPNLGRELVREKKRGRGMSSPFCYSLSFVANSNWGFVKKTALFIRLKKRHPISESVGTYGLASGPIRPNNPNVSRPVYLSAGLPFKIKTLGHIWQTRPAHKFISGLTFNVILLVCFKISDF